MDKIKKYFLSSLVFLVNIGLVFLGYQAIKKNAESKTQENQENLNAQKANENAEALPLENNQSQQIIINSESEVKPVNNTVPAAVSTPVVVPTPTPTIVPTSVPVKPSTSTGSTKVR